MCGRFTFQPTEEFYERFRIVHRLDALVARDTIALGQMVPVIIVSRLVNTPTIAHKTLMPRVDSTGSARTGTWGRGTPASARHPGDGGLQHAGCPWRPCSRSIRCRRGRGRQRPSDEA
jgi:hypothetical protein